ncbi:MAG TPA: hypothetical protein PKI03_02530 [Pseudomonadota bacterium]|nr:hypothetical protein [Pseudomonadota bacterium]
MNKRVGCGLTVATLAVLGCSKGSPRTEVRPDLAVADAALSAPLAPVNGTVRGEPFEVKAALALHRWRGGYKNVQLYEEPKTCAEASAPGTGGRAHVTREVNIVVRWKTGEHVSVEQRSPRLGGFNTYGPGHLVSVMPFDALDVQVMDAGSASAAGRIRFRAAGPASALAGEVAVTICPPSGGPPTDCVSDEECADGAVCRRDAGQDRATKTAKGMMGTFGSLGRCGPASPTP